MLKKLSRKENNFNSGFHIVTTTSELFQLIHMKWKKFKRMKMGDFSQEFSAHHDHMPDKVSENACGDGTFIAYPNNNLPHHGFPWRKIQGNVLGGPLVENGSCPVFMARTFCKLHLPHFSAGF